MNRIKKKNIARKNRQKRVRRKVFGTAEKPRLSVYRSLNHIYAQLINDVEQTTILAASTLSPELSGNLDNGGNTAAAQKVGELVAEKAKANAIESVVFDRGGRLYHGRIKALADAAREAGLKF